MAGLATLLLEASARSISGKSQLSCLCSGFQSIMLLQGYYFSGDGCRRDEDGYYWITGRVDDGGQG